MKLLRIICCAAPALSFWCTWEPLQVMRVPYHLFRTLKSKYHCCARAGACYAMRSLVHLVQLLSGCTNPSDCSAQCVGGSALMIRHVNSVDWRLDVQVAKDTPTKPGYGLGLYSAGYHSLAQIYSLLAKAAQACVQQRWDQAVRHLARAVKLETGMGYIEPPRMVMTLQPCLASVLVLSGDFVAGNKVVTESLERFPGTAWGRQAEAAVALAADEEHEGEVQKAAQSACKLIFGSSHL